MSITNQLTRDEIEALKDRGINLRRLTLINDIDYYRELVRQPIAFFPTASRRVCYRQLMSYGIPVPPELSANELRLMLLDLETTYYRFVCKNAYGYICDMVITITGDSSVQSLLDKYSMKIKRYDVKMIPAYITCNRVSIQSSMKITNLVKLWQTNHYGMQKHLVEVVVY